MAWEIIDVKYFPFFLIKMSLHIWKWEKTKLGFLHLKHINATVQQQYQSFPLHVLCLTGLEVGVGEPVLGHRKYEIVSLVVNELDLFL